jgi:lipopolysaccharide export system permease protein
VALLFAAAYSLGDLHGRNELTSIFSAGIPLWRFSLSLMVIGLIASVFSFYFEDLVVIPTLKQKNDLSRVLLHQQVTTSNSDVVIKARGGHLIYSVDYYDADTQTLNGLFIVEQGQNGEFVSLIRSPRAIWSGDHWVFTRPLLYTWDGGLLRTRPLEDTDAYREQPDTFKRSAYEKEDLPVREAGLLAEDLRSAGLPFVGVLANYYRRFSFAAASFVVIILSLSMGGRFKKNILLMSLLTSLGAAVVYYVIEMITMMLARLGYIPPLVGAWSPVAFFSLLGLLLLLKAKT